MSISLRLIKILGKSVDTAYGSLIRVSEVPVRTAKEFSRIRVLPMTHQPAQLFLGDFVALREAREPGHASTDPDTRWGTGLAVVARESRCGASIAVAPHNECQKIAVALPGTHHSNGNRHTTEVRPPFPVAAHSGSCLRVGGLASAEALEV